MLAYALNSLYDNGQLYLQPLSSLSSVTLFFLQAFYFLKLAYFSLISRHESPEISFKSYLNAFFTAPIGSWPSWEDSTFFLHFHIQPPAPLSFSFLIPTYGTLLEWGTYAAYRKVQIMFLELWEAHQPFSRDCQWKCTDYSCPWRFTRCFPKLFHVYSVWVSLDFRNPKNGIFVLAHKFYCSLF